MKAIIMAGGEGTRLRPLTCNKPKPMIEIMNKPVMEHIINLLKSHNITDIGVTLQYMPESIMQYFGDGKKFGVNISYFIEETPLGTAGSVKNAESFLDDEFLVISGDSLTDFNLTEAISYHHKMKSNCTILLYKVEEPLEYGVAVTGKNDVINRFLEKPTWSEVFSDYANTGIYIFSPEILKEIPENTKYDFSMDLFPKILNQNIYGYRADGYWCDIGDLSAYAKCHFDILDKKVKINFDEISLNADLKEGAIVERPVFIDDGVIIKSGAKIRPYSIILKNTVVEKNSKISRSIVGKNSKISENAQLSGAILCEGVQFGKRSFAFENSVIGANSHIGEMCEIKNNIKIWPSKIIDDETCVSENLIWGCGYTKNIFNNDGVDGEINVNITPEFATKLGATFGAVLNGNIGISTNGEKGAKMLKEAFVSGLLSTGAKIYNFNEMPLPVLRRATVFYNLVGSIYISSKKEKLFITFLDKKGINISRQTERKIENLFMREDFVRCEAENIGNVENLYFEDYYIREILNDFKLEKECNIESSYFDNFLSKIFPNAEFFSSLKGRVGGVFSDNLEEITLIDESGKVISQENYYYLICKILFELGILKFVLPVGNSKIFYDLAEKYNAKIILAKQCKSSIMQMLLDNDLDLQFRLMFDAPFALMFLLNYLSKKNIMLYSLTCNIPKINITKKEVNCFKKNKGSAMKIFAQKENRVETPEGVMLKYDDGWVFILPHNSKNLCKIYAESANSEFAEEICGKIEDEIKKINN